MVECRHRFHRTLRRVTFVVFTCGENTRSVSSCWSRSSFVHKHQFPIEPLFAVGQEQAIEGKNFVFFPRVSVARSSRVLKALPASRDSDASRRRRWTSSTPVSGTTTAPSGRRRARSTGSRRSSRRCASSARRRRQGQRRRRGALSWAASRHRSAHSPGTGQCASCGGERFVKRGAVAQVRGRCVVKCQGHAFVVQKQAKSQKY